MWPWPFGSDYAIVIFPAGVTLASWIFWGILFHQFRRLDEERLLGRLLKWLLGGSVLELLVAVPSHVIVRQRGDCCAPAGTFFGMATGVAIMFMTFGPGVLWLYAKRMEALRGGYRFCRKCGYDLRATPTRCPECGTEVDAARPSAGAAR